MIRISILLAALLAAGVVHAADKAVILNASYDVTREYFKDINADFATQWKAQSGQEVEINQSHGGSTKQARAVIDGLEADVVTMNQASDVDRIAAAGLVAKDWRTRFPNQAAPTTSTILFLVRKGNPKGIKDWADLIRPDVAVIIPNPKTSGNGRYSYLAAWAWALRQPGGDEAKAKAFVGKLFANVPVLDTGGRGATTTFAQRGIGDVLLTFESEVQLIAKDLGGDAVQPVVPSLSIIAENPVAVVDAVAKRHGTAAVAKAYLDFLYSPAGQEIAVRHHLRPSDAALLEKNRATFPQLALVGVDEIAGGWDKANATHFADGAIFDQITVKR